MLMCQRTSLVRCGNTESNHRRTNGLPEKRAAKKNKVSDELYGGPFDEEFTIEILNYKNGLIY